MKPRVQDYSCGTFVSSLSFVKKCCSVCRRLQTSEIRQCYLRMLVKLPDPLSALAGVRINRHNLSEIQTTLSLAPYVSLWLWWSGDMITVHPTINTHLTMCIVVTNLTGKCYNSLFNFFEKQLEARLYEQACDSVTWLQQQKHTCSSAVVSPTEAKVEGESGDKVPQLLLCSNQSLWALVCASAYIDS